MKAWRGARGVPVLISSSKVCPLIRYLLNLVARSKLKVEGKGLMLDQTEKMSTLNYTNFESNFFDFLQNIYLAENKINMI
jgi:hypothetical protein